MTSLESNSSLPFIEFNILFNDEQWQTARNLHKKWWIEHESMNIPDHLHSQHIENHWKMVVEPEKDLLMFFMK